MSKKYRFYAMAVCCIAIIFTSVCYAELLGSIVLLIIIILSIFSLLSFIIKDRIIEKQIEKNDHSVYNLSFPE